jgi:DNA-binding XRE family transcriptional regulator
MARQPAPPTPSKRLAAAVRAARTAQGLTQRQLAERGGIRPLTVLTTERGDRTPRPATLAALERGLGWTPGTAQAILAGAEPPMPGTSPPPGPPAVRTADSDTVDLAALAHQITSMQHVLVRVARHLGVDLSDLDGA